MSVKQDVLRSELAGVWYNDNPDLLAREVDVYLDAGTKTITGTVIALLLPHAGYRYSGMVAAAGLREVAGRTFSRVIVLGPSHRVHMPDQVSIPDVKAIETPLGAVRVDCALAEQLWDHEHFTCHPSAHSHEHSVQIELPLLQRALGDFTLLPIVCGDLSLNAVREVGKTLLKYIDDETLVVISSDFTHFGGTFGYVPFTESIQENLEQLDMNAFQLILKHDLAGFSEYISKTGATICGRVPISILLAMLPADAEVQLLKYDTSGNLTGDWMHCVSYVSAAVTGRWKTPGNHENETLTAEDKSALLHFARQRICEQLLPDAPTAELAVTQSMKELMGAFVTLHKNGQLRGCIGEIFPTRPLHEAIREQAVNSAFHDPRFPQLRADELGLIDIEISALTAPEEVPSYASIEVGRHGVVLRKGMHSAVFLPQVAPEQGWGLAEMLSHLSMKAGLPADAWQSDCDFYVFEAIVFGERNHEDSL
ncbi:MAG: AmmeMemoRadiSam system protein B [Pontiellaceae bacterium]|nr:AmmeMemoRadiSam system protein B [Pontiellaceae bacterium]MBN2785415.1 AmmeMemoRadiSam system protein B [Pontiellaceae bacterium]